MVSDQEPRYQLIDSSGTVVGTFYQKADGTLAVQDGVSENEIVFDGDTLGSGSETVDVGSVSTESVVIGGTLYEEDDNSPIDANSQSSITYTLNNPSDEVILIPDVADGFGFDNLQVNGDTGNNYDVLHNDDSLTTGLTAFQNCPRNSRGIWKIKGSQGNRITVGFEIAGNDTGRAVGGENLNVSPPINQITLSGSAGGIRSTFLRVYRRKIQ